MVIYALNEFLKGIQEKRNYPQGLHLNLACNELGPEGGKAIAKALESGHCPQGLQLDSRNNNLRPEGGEAIAKALESGQCSPGLKLVWHSNGLDAKTETLLQNAWYTYLRAYPLRCITLQQGHRQSTSPISRLPQELLNLIYAYVAPKVPIVAKMTEISAKVFRQYYTSGLFAEKSKQTDTTPQIDSSVEIALSAKSIPERAEKIRAAAHECLKAELGTLEPEQFADSPIVALLYRYHLVSNQQVAEKIKAVTHECLKAELGTLEPEQFADSPPVALLYRYHLVSNQQVLENPHQLGRFRLK